MADGGSVRDQLKESDVIRQASVIVHEWPGEPTVYIAELPLPEFVALGKETRRRMKRDKSRVRHIERMIIACARNQDGSRLFKDEDEEWLGSKGAAGLWRLYRICLRVNGQDEDEDDDPGNS